MMAIEIDQNVFVGGRKNPRDPCGIRRMFIEDGTKPWLHRGSLPINALSSKRAFSRRERRFKKERKRTDSVA